MFPKPKILVAPVKNVFFTPSPKIGKALCGMKFSVLKKNRIMSAMQINGTIIRLHLITVFKS